MLKYLYYGFHKNIDSLPLFIPITKSAVVFPLNASSWKYGCSYVHSSFYSTILSLFYDSFDILPYKTNHIKLLHHCT